MLLAFALFTTYVLFSLPAVAVQKNELFSRTDRVRREPIIWFVTFTVRYLALQLFFFSWFIWVYTSTFLSDFDKKCAKPCRAPTVPSWLVNKHEKWSKQCEVNQQHTKSLNKGASVNTVNNVCLCLSLHAPQPDCYLFTLGTLLTWRERMCVNILLSTTFPLLSPK